MSRGDLFQAVFVDVMVSGYGKVGELLDRLEKGSIISGYERTAR